MEKQTDALTPLHPPAPTAPPIVDATHDSKHDERRQKFEQIKHMPPAIQYISLTALIEQFIAAGHNPRDPNDLMFDILGITPEFLEAMLFAMKAKVPIHDLSSDHHDENQEAAKTPAAENAPTPAANTAA